jgi:hypothetical protein
MPIRNKKPLVIEKAGSKTGPSNFSLFMKSEAKFMKKNCSFSNTVQKENTPKRKKKK